MLNKNEKFNRDTQISPFIQRKGRDGGLFDKKPFFEPVRKITGQLKQSINTPKKVIQKSGERESMPGLELPMSIVCQFPDEKIFDAFLMGFYAVGWYDAARCLSHYRRGGGANLSIDVERLFASNPRIRTQIASLIQEQQAQNPQAQSGVLIGRGVDDGQVPPIQQSDYDSQNWRMALGNVDEVRWRALGGDRFEITIIDPYEWHDQEERVTQCVHQAMVRLQRHGAANFMVRATGTVTLPISP
jgi:hypothetical protein